MAGTPGQAGKRPRPPSPASAKAPINLDLSLGLPGLATTTAPSADRKRLRFGVSKIEIEVPEHLQGKPQCKKQIHDVLAALKPFLLRSKAGTFESKVRCDNKDPPPTTGRKTC